MFYVDSQRTITRRESSLIAPKSKTAVDRSDNDACSTTRGQSTIGLINESMVCSVMRPKGSVRRELITMLFESMLDSIVVSWDVIVPQKPDDVPPTLEFDKTGSEITISYKKKKNAAASVKTTKSKRSQSKIDVLELTQIDPLQQSWWSAPDERAVIRFTNGNIYEGDISMKCMHGSGRFQWADGTTYLGQFKDNEIIGKGIIQWKDDTWYEGDFVGNLRHGNGLYVDSRRQRSYTGSWDCGTKHGFGAIYYSETFKNSYEGEWNHNVRHGYGSREYCSRSGYKGQWDKYIREGKGLMIWPNSDFYRGEWKNGVMSGYGIYIWNAYYNNSMSLPSINAYRGHWNKGERNGYGVLNLGFGLGSHYKGEFKNNKKHGVGKFVTNTGLILKHKNLFIDDNMGPMLTVDRETEISSHQFKHEQSDEPFYYEMCDESVGLLYHIIQAIKNIDKQQEIRNNIINEYIENNKAIEADITMNTHKENSKLEYLHLNVEDFIEFEESSLRNSLRCYENELNNIYYTYATICNTDEINFTPVLIRLYLWQFFYDCSIHNKHLTLIEIDNLFHENPEWLTRTPHNPFEKIYFWQFKHCLISVANKLYAKKKIPDKKPDTILANAFRQFMEKDVLPGVGRRRGRFVNSYGTFLPLKAIYALYRKIGEPHSVRDFVCATRHAPHYQDRCQIDLVEASEDCLPIGRNVYVFGDEMTYVTDEYTSDDLENSEQTDLRLFNFGNLSSRKIINIFSRMFPQLCNNNRIMNLDVQLTFYEFFEAFVICAEESIRVKDEEAKWRKKFSVY